jgi:hypothetical protein
MQLTVRIGQMMVRGKRAGRGLAALAGTFAFCAAILAAAQAEPTPAAPSGTIPSGTRLRFHLSAPLASDKSKAGEPFSFAMLDPVVVDGRVLAAQGALGTGTVLVSGHNGTLGHEGDLTLRIDSIHLSDARIVRFADQQFEINGGNRKAESRILGLIPDAGIAALFMRGKEIHVDPATAIQTVLLHPATITENAPAPSASPT